MSGCFCTGACRNGGRCVARDSGNWHDLKARIAELPPMTAEQIFDQKVSWVFGQTDWPGTKDELRKKLQGM